MNYGPFYGMPYYGFANTARTGLFSRLLGGLSLSSIIDGTQKTLNVVNQIIPVVKQVQPIVNNAKTMFKVMNEFKRDEIKPTTITNPNETNVIEEKEEVKVTNSYDNAPTFFM